MSICVPSPFVVTDLSELEGALGFGDIVGLRVKSDSSQ
jgi:hypothetical protein